MARHAEAERARPSPHPTALKRRYDATHKVAETKGVAPKPQRVAHEQEVEGLKADVEMRDREIEWLKTKHRRRLAFRHREDQASVRA